MIQMIQERWGECQNHQPPPPPPSPLPPHLPPPLPPFPLPLLAVVVLVASTVAVAAAVVVVVALAVVDPLRQFHRSHMPTPAHNHHQCLRVGYCGGRKGKGGLDEVRVWAE